jgi:AmmeMemoRadiSam system protein A
MNGDAKAQGNGRLVRRRTDPAGQHKPLSLSRLGLPSLAIVPSFPYVLLMMMPEDERALLAVARASIARGFDERGTPLPTAAGSSAWEVPEQCAGRLSQRGGAFVTIREEGELRGCIGYIESPLPLWRVVKEVAEKAAFEDPRFHPLEPDEFEQMTIEISVLTAPQRMKTPDEIVIGEHGLIIEFDGRRGLLLPQVATEYGWDREEFLQHVCRKAGLAPGAWRAPGATIYLFRADIIGETHHA